MQMVSWQDVSLANDDIYSHTKVGSQPEKPEKRARAAWVLLKGSAEYHLVPAGEAECKSIA